MSMCGEKDGAPVKMPVALLDVLAAHQLKEGILVALIKKLKTGKGSFVSNSLYDSAIASLANQATNWLMAGHIPQRIGSQHPNIAPYGDILRTKDGKEVVIACGAQGHFVNLCAYFGREDLLLDARFHNNTSRVENRIALNDILEKLFITQNREELIDGLTLLQVPIGAIRNMKEVFESEASRSLILEEFQEGILTKRVKTVVFDIR